MLEVCVGSCTHISPKSALVAKIPRHVPNKLNLLVHSQARDSSLQDTTQPDLVRGDERVIVHEGEEAHDELTVHAIGHTTMPGNGVAKVLDFEGALESRGKEAAERRNQRSECGKDHGVDLHWLHGQAELRVLREKEQLRKFVLVGQEHRVGLALQPSENVGTKVLRTVSLSQLVKREECDEMGVWGSLH